VPAANALLNDILGQVLLQAGGDLEILRSRVVELTVLLSRASLKGGANIDAVLGLNYSYSQG
jgi:two-component system response regulator YesN